MTRSFRTRRLDGFGPTIFTEMTQLANEHSAINLAQGFPDFDGPEFVKEAGIAAIQAGRGQYARMTGDPALHEKIAASTQARYGVAYEPHTEIVVGCGATELIYATLAAICDAGDEVILLEPFYDSYRASVCMAGAIPKTVALRYPDFRWDEGELARAFTEKTRAIIINTPHNPTGRVLTRAELETVAALALKHDVLVISDEVYEDLVFDGEHIAIASLPGMRERTVSLHSLSKSFSLTGWRVGWALAPKPIADVIRLAHQFITFAAPTPMQVGAIAAIDAPAAYFEELRTSYRAKRDFLANALRDVGFEVRAPEGAYFICAGISRFGYGDDISFCRYLTREIGVAAIPPSAFYEHTELGKSYVRFTFCKRQETLAAAVNRLSKLKSLVLSSMRSSHRACHPRMVNLDSPCVREIREDEMTTLTRPSKRPSQARQPVAPSLSPREETKALFRNAVLLAAEEVFADRGFHGARIQDIAERAKVGVGTVYNHFAQKEDLLYALMEERSIELQAHFAAQPDDPTGFEGGLRARFRRMHDYVAAHRGFFTIACEQGLFGSENASPDALPQKARAARKQKFRDALESLLREGLAEGAIEFEDPMLMTRFFGGALRGVLEGALLDQKQDLKAEGDKVIDLFLRATAPRGEHSKKHASSRGGASR